MSENLKISESEFSVCKNKLTTYSEFLSSSLDTYISLLDKVLNAGIKDERIRSAITDLKTKVKPIASNLESSVSSVNDATSRFLSDVDSEDHFCYSDEGMSSILSVLSMFL